MPKRGTARRRWRHVFLVALTSTLVLLVGNFVWSGSAKVATRAPVRVMVMGDSITVGEDGDYTWRYRLAQHFAQIGADIDLVGDFTAPRHGTYAVGGWDMDHQAVWGMAARDQKTVTQAAVARHRPDYLVMHLGTNDLAFGIKPAAAVDDVRATIEAARAGRASIKVLLVEIIPRLGTDKALLVDYNSRLAALAKTITTARSPVAIAPTHTGFDPRTDLYDGTHPNRNGEFKIATVVAGGLWRSFGIGAAYDAIPTIPSGPDAPQNVWAMGENGSILLGWSPVRQATGYNIYARNLGKGETSFKVIQFGLTETTWRHHLVANGHQVEYHLTASRTYDESPRSMTVLVTPSARRPAIPKSTGIGG